MIHFELYGSRTNALLHHHHHFLVDSTLPRHDTQDLKGTPLHWLSQPPIRIAGHLNPQGYQNLLHAHIPIPIFGGGNLGINNFSSFRIYAIHVDA